MLPLRIVHVLRAPVGGLFRHVRDLAVEQSRSGHSVGIIVDANSSDSLTEKRLAPLRHDLALGVGSLPMPREPGFADIMAVRQTRAALRRLGVDVVHGHGAKGGLYARAAASQAGRGPHASPSPVRFYTPHGGSLHYRSSRLKGPLFAAAERALLSRTDGLIFESAFAKAAFDDFIGIGKTPARVVHNGLLGNEFSFRQSTDFEYDFVFVGELRKLKGVDLLLRALAAVSGKHKVRAVIVGEGPDRADFEALRDDLGLSGKVRFTGALPAREAFDMGRSLVMPSRAESLPYVALEAAAAGVPLIATDVGGVREITEGSDTMLVAPEDIDALAAALFEHLARPGEAHERALRLREIVRSRFSVTGMAMAVEDFYRSRLEARTMPGLEKAHPAAC